MERWLLPEGVEESLPPEAWRLESARRRLLDLYRSWGYELIRPPLIEYLDALLTGAGHDLDLETFKLTDQLSGRMMGVRSDMTTQAARIDARAQGEGVSRYCYIGSVLRTRPDGMGGSRTPLQIGAELFGSAGVQADLEIIRLMLASLEAVGLENISLDLGHVAIYRALEAEADLDADTERQLFDILQRKSLPDLEQFARECGLSDALQQGFRDLMQLNGGPEVLDEAADRLQVIGPQTRQALADMAEVVGRLQQQYPALPIHVDLAELRGYRYKTGIVFAAFVPGQGREVARGGRYDGVGASFGRARPATGFSSDLNALIDLAGTAAQAAGERVLAPNLDDTSLTEAVARLRSAGDRVMMALNGNDLARDAEAQGCTAILVQRDGSWVKEKPADH